MNTRTHGGAMAAKAASVLFDAHIEAERNQVLDATIATMVEEPHLLNLGSGIRWIQWGGGRRFYAEHLIGQFPPGCRIRAYFTHD